MAPTLPRALSSTAVTLSIPLDYSFAWIVLAVRARSRFESLAAAGLLGSQDPAAGAGMTDSRALSVCVCVCAVVHFAL